MSENLTLSPELQVKKKFNWFKFIFNAIWISFLILVFVLASRSVLVYWKVYQHIPVNEVEFYAIFDKGSYLVNENWQELGAQTIMTWLGIERGLWDQLLANGQDYWAVYWENSTDIKAKVLFYSPTPPTEQLLADLKAVGLSYIYKDNLLLLNDENLKNHEGAIPDLLMFNNVCVGRWQKQAFSCDFDKNIVKVSLTDPNLRPVEKVSVFNLDEMKNDLVYANNQLKISEISQFLPENLLFLLSPIVEKEISLLILDQNHPIFKNNWAVFLPEINQNEIFDQLQYQVAYKNRELRVNNLADGSRYEDELLNFKTFAWLDESFNGYDLKKLAMNQTGENFLYAYPFQKNLILSTDKNLFQDKNLFLGKSKNQPSNFSTKNIFVKSEVLLEFLPLKFLSERCPIFKIEEKVSNQIFSLCE